MTRPAPLTPADADMTKFDDMPFEFRRFARSDLVAEGSPEGILAALFLWGNSWFELPAGSLSNNDRSLAQAAGYGRAVKTWLKIKDEALRGWIECSDGRLYHPVVAEKVQESWEKRLRHRFNLYRDAIRQHNKREPDDERKPLSYENWQNSGFPTGIRDEQKATKQADLPLERPADSGKMSNGLAHDVRVTSDEKAGKGREGKGRESLDREILSPSTVDDDGIFGRVNELAKLAGLNLTQPAKLVKAIDQLKQWTGEGIDFETTIVPTIKSRSADNPTEAVYSLAYFDAAIRKRHGLASQGIKPVGPPRAPRARPPINARDDEDVRAGEFRTRLERAIGSEKYAPRFGPDHVAVAIVDDRFVKIRFRSDAERATADAGFEFEIMRAASAMGLTSITETLRP